MMWRSKTFFRVYYIDWLINNLGLNSERLTLDACQVVEQGSCEMAIFDGKPRQKANQNLPPREVPWVEK